MEKCRRTLAHAQGCWRDFKLQKKDGTLHKHGHGGPNDGLCPGSYNRPSSTRHNTAATQAVETNGLSTSTNDPNTDMPTSSKQSVSTDNVADALTHSP